MVICVWNGGCTSTSGIGPSSTVLKDGYLTLSSPSACAAGSMVGNWQKKTQSINLHITHFIWLLSVSAVNTTKYIPQIQFKFHYTTQVSFPLEHVILITAYDRKWTQPVLLTSLICGSMHFSSTALQFILSRKGCSRIAPILAWAPSSLAGSLIRSWK